MFNSKVCIAFIVATCCATAAAAASEDDSAKSTALSFAMARYCGIETDALSVVTEGVGAAALRAYREPLIAGAEDPMWDSVVVARDLQLSSIRAQGSAWIASFAYRRLAQSQGAGDQPDNFRVLVVDSAESDSFELRIEQRETKWVVINPPVIRIHGAVLAALLKRATAELTQLDADGKAATKLHDIYRWQTELLQELDLGAASEMEACQRLRKERGYPEL